MSLNPFTIIKQISALLKVKAGGIQLMDTIKTEAKPGWKTSEFYLHIISILVVIGSAATPLIPAAAFPWLAGAAVFLSTAYTVARTVAKATPTPADDAFLDALAGKLAPLIDLNAKAVAQPTVPASKP